MGGLSLSTVISKCKEDPPMQPDLKSFSRTMMGTGEGASRQPGTISTPGLNIKNSVYDTHVDTLALPIAQTQYLTHQLVSETGRKLCTNQGGLHCMQGLSDTNMPWLHGGTIK